MAAVEKAEADARPARAARRAARAARWPAPAPRTCSS